MKRRSASGLGIVGRLTIRKYGAGGELLVCIVTHNLTTYVGDQMYAEAGAGIAGAPAVPTGMKLGTGAATPSKSGGGSALGTYVSGSDAGFDAGFPQSAQVTIDGTTSRQILYQCTWPAGVATTLVNLTECALVNDALADATSTSANTVARALIGDPIPKDINQKLVIEWAHRLRGT